MAPCCLPPLTFSPSTPLDAVLSGDAERIEKAEIKLTNTQTEFHDNQAKIPEALKEHATHFKREEDYATAIWEKRQRLVNKQQQLHHYQPCRAFLRLCDHCQGRHDREEFSVEDGPEQEHPSYLGETGLEVAVENLREPKEDTEAPLRELVGRLVRKVCRLKRKHS